MAYWGHVSDGLCLELMRFDCANCIDGEKEFDNWTKTGTCPFKNKLVVRSINFQENAKLWIPGPAKSPLELIIMLFKEKNIKWNGIPNKEEKENE